MAVFVVFSETSVIAPTSSKATNIQSSHGNSSVNSGSNYERLACLGVRVFFAFFQNIDFVQNACNLVADGFENKMTGN
jgi:hypothetical protein